MDFRPFRSPKWVSIFTKGCKNSSTIKEFFLTIFVTITQNSTIKVIHFQTKIVKPNFWANNFFTVIIEFSDIFRHVENLIMSHDNFFSCTWMFLCHRPFVENSNIINFSIHSSHHSQLFAEFSSLIASRCLSCLSRKSNVFAAFSLLTFSS